MQLSNIKIIKKLGAGMIGTVYLIEYENEKYAMKVQKILEDEKIMNIKYTIWREILFYNDVNKMSPEAQKFFCKLYGFKIIEDCKHKQIRSKVIPALISVLNKMNKSNICIVLIIDYKGTTTLYDFLGKKLSKNQIYSILLQVYKIILLLSDLKYSHNDLHPGNIMIQATNDKTFEIMGYHIPYNGLQLVAIDYGNMTNEKYSKKYNEDEETYYLLQLTESLFYILQNKPKLEKDCRMQKKEYPYEKKNFKNNKNNIWKILFQNHKKNIDKYAEKYLQLYPNLRKFYSQFKKNIHNSSIRNIHKNEIKVFLLKIMNNFALDYPEEYMNLTDWCSPPEYILPKKDILEILECKTREDYFKFFKDKLKSSRV
jgi:serine/threonine protein kinase